MFNDQHDFFVCEEAQRKLLTLHHEALERGLRHLAHPSLGWRDVLGFQLFRLALRLSPGLATSQSRV